MVIPTTNKELYYAYSFRYQHQCQRCSFNVGTVLLRPAQGRYGSRPRLVAFESIEAFRADCEFLMNKLDWQQEQKAIQQQKNFAAFISRIDAIQEHVPGTDREHAIEILADGEDELEAMGFYGYERLEWTLNLEYRSIKRWLAE